MIPSQNSKTPIRRNWKAFVESVAVLIGHIIVTGAIFLSLIVTGWSASFLVHFLNSIHPFPFGILAFITKFELYLFYGDSVLCAFVLVGGAIRFIADDWEGQK